MKALRHLVILAVLLAVTIGIASAQDDEMPVLEIEGGEIIATGLNLPQGVLVAPDGNIWVIDSGVGGEDEILFLTPGATEAAPSPFGNTARVLTYTPDGEESVYATLPSIVAGMDIIGGARLALLDDTLYATSGQWLAANGDDRPDLLSAVVTFDEDGIASEVANTYDIEAEENPDGFAVDSHPYGLAVSPDGWLWVADAGANTVIRINPETGDVELVATISGMEGPFPNADRNDAMEVDPVPTGIAFDADGNAYVSLLSGFPFLPNSTKIIRINADDMSVEDYATGLTMLTDLTMGPDGVMYAVQLAEFGSTGPVPDSGAIVRIQEGDASEVVIGGLPSPTGMSFDADGNAYVVVNGGFAPPGLGALVRFDAVTEMDGTPIMDMIETES